MSLFKKLWAVAFSGPKSGSVTSPSEISNDEMNFAYEQLTEDGRELRPEDVIRQAENVIADYENSIALFRRIIATLRKLAAG